MGTRWKEIVVVVARSCDDVAVEKENRDGELERETREFKPCDYDRSGEYGIGNPESSG